MADTAFNQLLVASFWNTMCQSAQSHAMLMAQQCRGAFADLILNEARKLCGQDVPTTYAELDARQAQSMSLISKIAAIAHADAMARMHPNVTCELFGVTKEFCDCVPLNDTVYTESMALLSEIRSICHTDAMRRLTGG